MRTYQSTFALGFGSSSSSFSESWGGSASHSATDSSADTISQEGYHTQTSTSLSTSEETLTSSFSETTTTDTFSTSTGSTSTTDESTYTTTSQTGIATTYETTASMTVIGLPVGTSIYTGISDIGFTYTVYTGQTDIQESTGVGSIWWSTLRSENNSGTDTVTDTSTFDTTTTSEATDTYTTTATYATDTSTYTSGVTQTVTETDSTAATITNSYAQHEQSAQAEGETRRYWSSEAGNGLTGSSVTEVYFSRSFSASHSSSFTYDFNATYVNQRASGSLSASDSMSQTDSASGKTIESSNRTGSTVWVTDASGVTYVASEAFADRTGQTLSGTAQPDTSASFTNTTNSADGTSNATSAATSYSNSTSFVTSTQSTTVTITSSVTTSVSATNTITTGSGVATDSNVATYTTTRTATQITSTTKTTTLTSWTAGASQSFNNDVPKGAGTIYEREPGERLFTLTESSNGTWKLLQAVLSETTRMTYIPSTTAGSTDSYYSLYTQALTQGTLTFAVTDYNTWASGSTAIATVIPALTVGIGASTLLRPNTNTGPYFGGFGFSKTSATYSRGIFDVTSQSLSLGAATTARSTLTAASTTETYSDLNMRVRGCSTISLDSVLATTNSDPATTGTKIYQRGVFPFSTSSLASP